MPLVRAAHRCGGLWPTWQGTSAGMGEATIVGGLCWKGDFDPPWWGSDPDPLLSLQLHQQQQQGPGPQAVGVWVSSGAPKPPSMTAGRHHTGALGTHLAPDPPQRWGGWGDPECWDPLAGAAGQGQL